MKKALILSDGKPGHFNQSVAYCKHLHLDYKIVKVEYKSRGKKAFSYLLDHLNIYTKSLFSKETFQHDFTGFNCIVSTGSTTYYANKLLAKQLQIPNIAILYPKGYRLDFTHLFIPAYDHPPKQKNCTELPINLCAADPDFFDEKAREFKARHTPKKEAVGIIIGGSNAVSEIDPVQLKKELEQLFKLTPDAEHWVTTSRRTSPEVEQMIEQFPFDYVLINSRESYNPIPAFIHLCERLFVTSDSASMISECASFGTAKVEILFNKQLKTPNKFEELIEGLVKKEAVHIFDGTLGTAQKKIDLTSLLSGKNSTS